jgi:hypothetical protein
MSLLEHCPWGRRTIRLVSILPYICRQEVRHLSHRCIDTLKTIFATIKQDLELDWASHLVNGSVNGAFEGAIENPSLKVDR